VINISYVTVHVNQSLLAAATVKTDWTEDASNYTDTPNSLLLTYWPHYKLY